MEDMEYVESSSISDDESKEENTIAAGGRGKHSTYKLYIGWQHFSSGRYRVVTVKKGGGTRMLEYKCDEDLNVKSIIEKGVQYFFPKGKSQLGELKDMTVSLASFSRENLDKFTDLKGQDCSFQEYLKSHGLFSSQYHLYIRTKLKQEITVAEKEVRRQEKLNRVLLVNDEIPGKITLTFKRTKISRYSNSESSISCSSMNGCYSLSRNNETPYEEYNCVTDDGFLVTKIEKDDKVYVTELDDGSYLLNDYRSTNNSAVAMYGPDQIYGMNDGDLMLGYITNLHNQNTLYRWFKDGNAVFEGQNACLLKVTTPGEYSVGIYSDSHWYMYDEQCVVKECFMAKDAEQLLKPSQQMVSVDSRQTTPFLSLPSASGQTSVELEQLSVDSGQSAQLLPIDSRQSAQLSPIDSGQSAQLPIDSGQSAQLLPIDSRQSAQLSPIDSGQSAQLPIDSGQSAQLPIDSGQSAQLLPIDSRQSAQLSPIDSGQSAQLPIDSRQSAQLSPTDSGQSAQLPIDSGQSAQFSCLPEHTTQASFSTGHKQHLSIPLGLPALPPALLEHTENLLLPSRNAASLSVHSEKSSVPQNFPITTEVKDKADDIGCISLPKVSLTDINIGEEIGRGAFGTVRKGEWLGTEVAVKEINVKCMKFAKPLIKQELCIHSKVRHPNIIQLMAYTLEKNKLLMISELNDGKNLDDVIFGEEYDGIISDEQQIYIAKNVIQAVAYLHNQNPAIIHRDIKPENILVSSYLKRIHLCDLGISRLKTMNTVATTSVGLSVQPGTPAYQAPEVLLDHKSGSTHSDIWSMGCTILELLTELPTWNIQQDADPVMYIVSHMKGRKQPDAMQQLLASKFANNFDMIEMLNMALSYDIHKRPSALWMLKVCKA